MSRDKEEVKKLGDGRFGDTEFVNYLGPGNFMEGKLSFSGRALLFGSSVLGNISAQDDETEIYIGPETKIEGDIKGQHIVFGGLMTGTIAAPQLDIIKEGVFSGEIITDRRLTIEDGAKLSAHINMKQKKKTKKK
jgi:cytoskeletal protein CcmA (bactofilin family)